MKTSLDDQGGFFIFRHCDLILLSHRVIPLCSLRDCIEM